MPTRYSLCTKVVVLIDKKTGIQRQWTPTSQRGKTVYYYWICFEDGSAGRYGSLYEGKQDTFIVGRMSFFTHEQKMGKMFMENIIKAHAPVKSLLPEGQAKIKEKQLKLQIMAKQDEITFKVAKATMSSAQRAYDALGREMTDRATLNCLVVKLSKWILLNGYDEEKVKNRLFVLEEAIVFANWHKEGYDSSDAIINLADGLISEFREIVKEISKK
jgi:hypothetical protein